MTKLNIAVLGCPGYSRELGKKGTESDITLYNMKKGETTVTIIEASKYPEKIQSLAYAAGFGDFIILVVDEINASFGETVLMLDCIGKEGIIIPRNYITEEQLSRFIAGTVDENADGIVKASIQNPLVFRDGEKATMLYLNGGNLRVVGSIKL